MAILAIDFVIIDSTFGLKFRNYKKKITSLIKFSFSRLKMILLHRLFFKEEIFKNYLELK